MNAVLEAARRIVAWDDSGRLADDEWLVERNETAIIAICRALLSASSAVRGMREALEKIARQDLSVDMSVDDQLGGDFEGAYNYMIEDARAALSARAGEDEQATRGEDAATAPISTDKKGTTK